MKWQPWYVKIIRPVTGLIVGNVYPVDVYPDSVQCRLEPKGDIQLFPNEYKVIATKPIITGMRE